MPSANGLRHPASASCLGRHLRLAGRCPNNFSLFPPLAAVVVVAGHIQRKNYFKLNKAGASADAPALYFHGWGGVTENGSCSAAFCESAALRESAVGLCPHPSAPFGRSHLPPTGGRQPSQGELNSLSQNLTVLPAPSGREPLAWRQRLRLKCKVPAAKNLPLRGRWHRAAMTERVRSPGGAVAQRLRGFKSAEPEKRLKDLHAEQA